MIKQLSYIDFHLVSLIEEVGNYTRIAEKLHLTQPAITHRVNQMALVLGKPIIAKLGKRIVLTETGQLIRDSFPKLKSFYQELDDNIKEIGNSLSGTLTIGTSDTLGIHLLPEFIAGFGKLYPDVKLNLTSKPSRVVAQEMISGTIDLGIALTTSIDNRYDSFPILERHDCVIVASDSKWKNRDKISLKELKKDKLITLDKTSQSRFFIVEWFRKRGITIDIAMELGSIEMVKRYVEMDLGFSIVPEISIQNELKEGRLHKIEIDEDVNYQTVAAFTVKNKYVSLIARRFIDYVIESVKK